MTNEEWIEHSKKVSSSFAGISELTDLATRKEIAKNLFWALRYVAIRTGLHYPISELQKEVDKILISDDVVTSH